MTGWQKNYKGLKSGTRIVLERTSDTHLKVKCTKCGCVKIMTINNFSTLIRNNAACQHCYRPLAVNLRIIKFIQNNPNMTIQEMATSLKISRQRVDHLVIKVRRYLSKSQTYRINKFGIALLKNRGDKQW